MSDSDNGHDLDPGEWEALPSDSETEVEFPEFDPTRAIRNPGYPAFAYVPPKEILVQMTVEFPDGVHWEHVERVDFDNSPNMDVHAQAAAMIEEVSETMKNRIERVLD